MTGREWEPGDVAMTAKHTVALCHNGGQMIDQGGAPWSNEKFPDNLRPLVVIDPEDREQVEAFTHLFLAHYWGDEHPTHTDAGQAALREFANPTPPRPDEPTGLGAVVEDAEGAKWVRGSSMPGLKLWVNDEALDSEWRSYRDITAVRVLSAGWSE